MESKSLVERLSEIEGPLRAGYAHRHNLVEILVIAVCAMCADVEGFAEMENWARAKEPWLRRFLKLEHGIASHDTLRRVFALLDPHAYEKAFRARIASVLGAFGQLAIDGKVLRCLASADNGPLHMVSAFATGMGLVHGQEAVADRSNEITAIPVLLAALDVQGCLVSIDAMDTQRDIARTIVSQGANYLLTVKTNQPMLRAAGEDVFTDTPLNGYVQVQREHRRVVLQHAQIIANTGQADPALWPGCKSLGRVILLRDEGQKAPKPGDPQLHQFGPTGPSSLSERRAQSLGDRKQAVLEPGRHLRRRRLKGARGPRPEKSFPDAQDHS